VKLPKQGTNPRGVEITKKALESLIKDKEIHKIEIDWKRKSVNNNVYTRWVDLWGD